LMAALYFLRVWPLSDDRNPDAELAKITGKETAEIHEVLAELGRRGVLIFSEDRVTGFSRDDALRLLDEEATV
jgi:predicted transcriptional regulator